SAQRRTRTFQIRGHNGRGAALGGLFAVGNSMPRAAGKATLSHTNNSLYAIAKTTYSDYHDVHSGNNGACGSLCNSVTGYDTVTGIGSPRANVLIPALANR